MITDALPHDRGELARYKASDALWVLALHDRAALVGPLEELERALASGGTAPTRRAAAALMKRLAESYGTPVPRVRVLGARPLFSHEGRPTTYELFGDYDLDTQVIRLWMRTAKLEKVTTFRGFVSTLLHEFCHHLDLTALGLRGTPHTRGFFMRVDALYHHVLDTPPEKRRRLEWVEARGVWRIDWSRSRPPARKRVDETRRLPTE